MDVHELVTGSAPWMIDTALLVGRIFIGACFVIHALGKLGVVGKGNLETFSNWLASLGVPFAPMQARMAMLSELVGGALLAAGLLTRGACVVLFFTMVVAGVLGHRGAGYLITNDPPGAEYTINLAVICAVFALMGPGAYSLDAVVFG